MVFISCCLYAHGGIIGKTSLNKTDLFFLMASLEKCVFFCFFFLSLVLNTDKSGL